MQPPKGFLIWLAGLSVLGFLATDMYLPAFPAIQHDLGGDASAVSASLSLFLAGFAFAQLAWGPLSDKYGRKFVLLTGLTIFALSCLGMLWVENVTQLLILRFIQAAGVCSAAVSWQALVTDVYPARRASRIFATIMPLVGLSPALAPLLGSWLLHHFDWQAIFTVLFIITLILMIPALRLKPHVAKPTPGINEKVSFCSLLHSRSYVGNVLIYAACSASFFAWLTGSPFIISEMGYGSTEIGLSYIPQTIAFLIGGYGCRSALQKYQGKTLLPWLLIVYGLSTAATWGVAVSGHASLTLVLIPFCVMAMANGAIYPVVVAAALLPFAHASGKAAALQNTLQLALCCLASLAVSWLVVTPLLTTTTVMFITVLLVGLGYKLQQGAGADKKQHAPSPAPISNIRPK